MYHRVIDLRKQVVSQKNIIYSRTPIYSLCNSTISSFPPLPCPKLPFKTPPYPFLLTTVALGDHPTKNGRCRSGAFVKRDRLLVAWAGHACQTTVPILPLLEWQLFQVEKQWSEGRGGCFRGFSQNSTCFIIGLIRAFFLALGL